MVTGIENSQRIYNAECSICLEEIPLPMRFTAEKCQHAFHRACIQEWQKQNITCPICREPLKETIEPWEKCPPGYIRSFYTDHTGRTICKIKKIEEANIPRNFQSIDEIMGRIESMRLVNHEHRVVPAQEKSEFTYLHRLICMAAGIACFWKAHQLLLSKNSDKNSGRIVTLDLYGVVFFGVGLFGNG